MTNPDPGAPADAASAGLRFTFANVDFDAAEGSLQVGGVRVDLEPRPLRLLAEMLRHAGEVMTRDELIDSVWEGRVTVDHVVANAVSKLRAALGAEGAARLQTVPRIGYRLLGPVQRHARLVDPSPLLPGQPLAGREGYVLEKALGNRRRQDVWLARHLQLGHLRVFKFAQDGERLSALKREYTLYRVLTQELGPREDFARVLDANFARSPCYLECEYGGDSLLDWAGSGAGLAAMSLDERVALFLQAARALAAAHGVGVLHKDIKPANILVKTAAGAAASSPESQAAHWQLCLTDFGSGRLLDAARLQALDITALGLTQTQDQVLADAGSGTLAYMAPELLARQAPTTQTDLYALGLVLLQMAVGDLQQTLAPGWQRQLADPLLADDVSKATEGRPEDRLSSVGELVQRLEQLPQRRLARQQAAADAARQQAMASQLARSQARRPWVVAAVASLSLGLVFSLFLAGRERAAQQRADEQSRRALAVNDFLTKDLLVAADLRQTPGGDRPVTMLDLLRRGSQAAVQRFEGQPLMEVAARHHLARTFNGLWAKTEARAEYDRALAMLRPLVPPDDDLLLTMELERLIVVADQIERDAARADLDRIEAVLLASLGPGRLPAAPELAMLLLQCRVYMLHVQGRHQDELPLARQWVAMADATAGTPLGRRVDARAALAATLRALGDPSGAERVFAELALPPFDRARESRLAISNFEMTNAGLLRDEGRHAEAEALLAKVHERLTQDKLPSAWHQGYLDAERGHNFRAWSQREGRPLDPAAQHYRQSVDHFRRGLGDEHQFVRAMQLNLVTVDLTLARYDSALAELRDMEAWIVARASAHTQRRLQLMFGQALLGLGRPEDALVHLRRVPAPTQEPPTRPPESWQVNGPLPPIELLAWDAQALQGLALLQSRQAAQGQPLLRQAVDVLTRTGWLPRGDASFDALLRAEVRAARRVETTPDGARSPSRQR